MAKRHKPPGTLESEQETSVLEDTQLEDEASTERITNDDRDLFPQQESEEIDISEKVKEEETVMIDFEAGDFSDHFAGKKTIDSQQEKTNDKNKTLGEEEIRSQIKDYEAGKSRSQTFADFQTTAEFMLNFFDMIYSNVLKFFAKDTSSSAYQLQKGDLKRLIDPLAMVLAKHSSKFAIEWIFILGIVSAYSGPTMKAKYRRDELSGKRKPEGGGDQGEYVTEKSISKETNQEESSSITVPTKKPYRRKRGSPSK